MTWQPLLEKWLDPKGDYVLYRVPDSDQVVKLKPGDTFSLNIDVKSGKDRCEELKDIAAQLEGMLLINGE